MYLRPKGLNLLKGFLNKKSKVEGKKLLLSIVSSVFTVMQNNEELADGQFVDQPLLEHALKLLPSQKDGAME